MDAADGMEPIETASADQLRSLQLARLKETVGRAYRKVPHYRRAFDDAGVHPDDLEQLSDISKFPFTTKQHLRDNYPFGMLAVPMDDIIRIHASSGTTGKPTVVAYTRGDIQTWSQLMARSISRRRRPLDGQDPGCVWIWSLHRRPRRALWRRMSWCGGHPRQRGDDRTAGADHM